MTETLNLTDFRILLVDDDAFMRNLVIRLLRSFGIKKIIEANNGKEALGELQKHKFDIIITDWLMSPLDGLSLTKEIRKSSKPHSNIPIILLTAYSDYKRVTRARDSGVTEVLCKPLSPSCLYQRIQSIIDHPRHFITTASYVGPDRRRKKKNFLGEDKRSSNYTEETTSFIDRPIDADHVMRGSIQSQMNRQDALFQQLSSQSALAKD